MITCVELLMSQITGHKHMSHLRFSRTLNFVSCVSVWSIVFRLLLDDGGTLASLSVMCANLCLWNLWCCEMKCGRVWDSVRDISCRLLTFMVKVWLRSVPSSTAIYLSRMHVSVKVWFFLWNKTWKKACRFSKRGQPYWHIELKRATMSPTIF